MKHVTYWGIKNIRCHCAKWSHLDSSVLVTNWNCQKCRKMSPVYQCRQQPINCVCVVFHRSQPTAGGRNKPFSVAVLGLKWWKTIICLWYYSAWYVACLGSYCTHVTWQRDTESLLNWCTTEHFHIFFFYSNILWHFLRNLEEALMVTDRDHCRTCILCQKDGSVWKEQKTALCWTICTCWERATCWVSCFLAVGWVTDV